MLKVVDSEGGIHPVEIPTCEQLHANKLHVLDEDERDGSATPQAMLYQALFGGTTEGAHGQGFSKKVFQARVLIDSGATRNFVSQRYVDRHRLKTFAAEQPMNVALADGKRLVANRKVAITLDFGSYKYTRNVYVLPLGVSADVILGMPWLYSLGSFECNMRTKELSFISRSGHGYRRIVLEGQPNAPKLDKSTVLPYGKAIREMRNSLRLLKANEGPTVEQVKTAAKAIRQPGKEPYGYDHEEDPRANINPAWLVKHPGNPLCYLCYLLPSRDVEDIEGGADREPRIYENMAGRPNDLRTGEREPKPAGTQEGTTWELPIPGKRIPWEIASTTDEAGKACLGSVTSALDHGNSTSAQVEKANAAIANLVRTRKTLGDTFWTQERRAAAAAIVQEEFEDIFKEELPIREGPEVDTTKTPATIRFKDSYDGETPFRKGIKMAPRELQQCREQLLELLQKGYIGPSASPFGAPILMVPKPTDPTKLRMVVDYRAINALTQSDRYPLPDITTMMQEMQGKRVFSTIDLLWGFWQIPMLEEHKERTAMTTQQFGAFEWNCLPMGLKNSPSIFQRAMQDMLRDLDFCHCYIDDVIVASDSPE